MKKIFVGAAVLWGLSLFFAGCGSGGGAGGLDDGGTDGGEEEKGTPITSVDLTNVIPAPVTGGAVLASFYAGSYGGTMVWYEVWMETGLDGEEQQARARVTPKLFEMGKDYLAEVSFASMTGYTFPASVKVTHNGSAPKGVSPLTYPPPRVDITFPPTDNSMAQTVQDLILTGKVPKPVADVPAIPSVLTTEYVGPVDWVERMGSGTGSVTTQHHGNFKPGTMYTAKLTLVAVSGRVFAGTPAFTHTDAMALPSTRSTGNGTFEVTIDFAAILRHPLDLTDKVLKPEAGQNPVRTWDSPSGETKYYLQVEWTVTGNDAVLNENARFQSGTAYTAKVTVYLYEEITDGSKFIHLDATHIAQDGGSSDEAIMMLVSIDFPPTPS
jgi:hypothetical protein